MHTEDYLRGWYFNHLFDLYPKKRFNAGELPDSLLKGFGLPRDEVYFIGRGNLEIKHWMNIYNWKKFFNLGDKNEFKDIILIGDGLGQRTFVSKALGLDVIGTDISKYAVKQVFQEVKDCYFQDDIIDTKLKEQAKLVVLFDVLEHLKYEDLDKAINNIIKLSTKYILISIPVLGNPQLDLDVTHIIKESEEWWLEQFKKKGLKRIKTPDNFLYKEQVYIFSKILEG